jgi:large subunit ribosomal protein L15
MNPLHNLRPSKNQSKKIKRVGRGNGSGHGTYACKGGKGQTARSGGQRRPGFEGGQTPLYRLMPKLRGFRNYNEVTYQVVNLIDIEENFKGKSKVTKADLLEAKLIKGNLPVKLLGNGEITLKIEIEVDRASKSAITAIEKAGGKVIVLQPKIEKSIEKKKNKKQTKKQEEVPESTEESAPVEKE